MGINRVVLTGRLTRDPELRYTQSGTAVANFSLAVNRKYNRDETDFIRCVAWRKTAELAAEYLRKGSQAGVEGNIRVSSYEKDGQKRYSTEVYIDQLEFLDSKGSSKGLNNTGSSKNSSDEIKEDSVEDEDFPF
ncbi:MAG: single-stranded DNA-binding protein [Fusobacteriota bacterium]